MTHVRELFNLSGKVAIVTGGGTGIGLQAARTLAELGADIVLCARKPDRCVVAAAGLVETTGVRALGMRCDVTDEADVERLVSRARNEFGRIDVLINNAGTAWGAPALDISRAAWGKVLSVNLTGLFFLSQSVARVMVGQGGGKIVNVASISALRGQRPEHVDAVPYSASKGAVVALTRDLAVKWAARHGYVNALAPGWFPSTLSRPVLDASANEVLAEIPLRRFGGDDDLAGAVAFLASSASDFVTEQTITVDGGQTV